MLTEQGPTKLTDYELHAIIFPSLLSFDVVYWVTVKGTWPVRLAKKHSERREHCVLALVRWSQKFCLATDPLPRGAGRPKFNQLEMVTTFTYKLSLVRIDACNFELS